MKLFSLLVGIISLFSLTTVKAQSVEQLDYEALHKKIENYKDKVVVVNFWATWCRPCVEEIPDFMEVNEKYKENSKFKLLFVSLDRAKTLQKVKKFIKDHNMNAEVVLLDDVKRMNEWIPSFDKSWAGNIPVSIIYKNGEKVLFHNKAMTKYELEDYLTEYLK